MAWSRIDDSVPHHRKFSKLGTDASWLWVCGLVHANRELTDGFIQTELIPLMGIVPNPHEAAQRLVKAGLWITVDGGFQIHHFHDFNPTVHAIKQRREADRIRKEATRSPHGIHAESEQNPSDASRARAIPSHPIPSPPDPEDLQFEVQANPKVLAAEKKRGSNGRSRRPIFAGQRFVIFDWMLEDMGRTLGPHLDAFDIHTWLDALDQQAVRDGLVKAKRDWWPWVQTELLSEAKRRGLPAGEVGFAVSDQTKQNLQAMKGAITRIQGRKS